MVPSGMPTRHFSKWTRQRPDFGLSSATREDPVGDETLSTSTWEGFRQHAEFPAALTTIELQTITTDLGRFDVQVYRVKPAEGTGPTRVFYFATTLPGPPIRVAVIVGGEPETVVMDMVEHD